MVDLIGCIVEYEEIMGSIELGEWTFKVVEVNRMKERCAVSLKEEGCEKKNGQNLTKSSLNLLPSQSLSYQVWDRNKSLPLLSQSG